MLTDLENSNIKLLGCWMKVGSVFSVKKKRKKEKGMKNTKKSYAWSGFSKIGLQLDKWILLEMTQP